MKKLSKQAYNEIRLWMHRNARQIELAIWRYEFEKVSGGAEVVVSALSHYQNEDGGFGNALEPDCWNPASSPYTTLNAIGILNNVNFSNMSHPVMRGIFRFLESGAHCRENGWLFSIPGNNDYPHAPWWAYDPKANEYEHLGVTAGLVCFLLQFAPKCSALYEKALGFAEKLLAKFNEPGNIGDMGLNGFCALLETIERLKLNDRLDISFLSSAIKQRVDEAIVRDPAKWADYGVRPLQLINSPDSPYYTGNENIVEKELDYIIDTRPPGGVWGITWQWWDNYAKYPKAFAISENWWKASIAIGTLKNLWNFGRMEI